MSFMAFHKLCTHCFPRNIDPETGTFPVPEKWHSTSASKKCLVYNRRRLVPVQVSPNPKLVPSQGHYGGFQATGLIPEERMRQVRDQEVNVG